MRKCVAIAVLALVATGARADWVPMSGTEIKTALSDAKLIYEDAWQVFRPSGFTLYNAGRDSRGSWRVEGDRYCSQWPPADGWACYAMERETGTGALRFIGESGDITEGRIAE
ncbi:MAG: hypothetical protein QNJ44_18755 [Rhodobacter sp.]|nr:hypothetical protein [Rhodobacter sp.]